MSSEVKFSGFLPRLTLTRLRVLSEPGSRQEDLWLVPISGGERHVEWLARVDGSAGSCPKGVAYRNAADQRRAEERELLDRLLSPEAAFIDGRD